MQLIIESESTSDINMTTLDETPNAVILDMKKDIQSAKDVHKEITPEDTDEQKQPIVEFKTNGDVQTSNVNGTESPNNDKENDAPKEDMFDAETEEENIENITNCVNSLFGITEDVKSDSVAAGVDTEESTKDDGESNSVQNHLDKEDDTKMLLDNNLDNDKPESLSAQFENNISEPEVNGETKENSSSLPSESDHKAIGDACQDSVEPDQVSELPTTIETPEENEVDDNSTVESEQNVDTASNHEDTHRLTAAEEISLNDAVSNDEDKTSLHDSATINEATCDEVDKTPLQNNVTEDNTESTATLENDIIVPNECISDQRTDTKIDNESIHTDATIAEDVVAPSKDNNITDETSHMIAPTIDTSNKTEDKLCDKENDAKEIVLDPCEKIKDEENDVIATISSSNDVVKVNDNNDVNDTDLILHEKVTDSVTENQTLHKDITIDSTNDITDEKILDDKNDSSSKENLPSSQEKSIEEEDVTKSSSIEQKVSDSTDIGSKVSDKIGNEVTQISEGKKESDSVSISSMDVDDVEIVPQKKDTETKESGTNVSQDNNVIEIYDQDSTETNTDKVDSKSTKEFQETKPDETIPSKEIKNKDEVSDEDDIKIVEESKTEAEKEQAVKPESKPLVVCKLSNTLDILSDDEEETAEPPLKKAKIEEKPQPPEDKQCINLDDDDDIMLIEDTKEPEKPTESEKPIESEVKKPEAEESEPCQKENKTAKEPSPKIEEKDVLTTETDTNPKISEKEPEPPKEEVKEPPKPLLPMNVLKSAKKNLSEMTRDELEEFCILKIVESIVERSSLSEIKKKMKVIEQNMEEYKKKALMLAKQNRDLQVVLKSVQEEQKNRPNSDVTPLKITRSVGMQVVMLLDKNKKKPPGQQNNTNAPKPVNRTPQTPRPQRTQTSSANIPVPKLIPASPAKTPSSPMANVAKPQTPNGIKNTPPPVQKSVEKRPLTRQSIANTSMTVDLTDDDPPAKVTKSSPVPPVRLVPSQNLMAPRPQTPGASPRKVFIPINGPGQTVLLKNISQQQIGPRGRFAAVPRLPQNQVRMAKVSVSRHPAPLPDVMKQYQPPTWKALPPAPDLKLSKAENGIVISWKIEGYQEDSYEKIASYQLYAYQETSTPPSTALWKKIGDVKALPLPMACTLTQFMAGFKYYFAVRAVDVKSRLGPFSLPGSILLLNKM